VFVVFAEQPFRCWCPSGRSPLFVARPPDLNALYLSEFLSRGCSALLTSRLNRRSSHEESNPSNPVTQGRRTGRRAEAEGRRSCLRTLPGNGRGFTYSLQPPWGSAQMEPRARYSSDLVQANHLAHRRHYEKSEAPRMPPAETPSRPSIGSSGARAGQPVAIISSLGAFVNRGVVGTPPPRPSPMMGRPLPPSGRDSLPILDGGYRNEFSASRSSSFWWYFWAARLCSWSVRLKVCPPSPLAAK